MRRFLKLWPTEDKDRTLLVASVESKGLQTTQLVDLSPTKDLRTTLEV